MAAQRDEASEGFGEPRCPQEYSATARRCRLSTHAGGTLALLHRRAGALTVWPEQRAIFFGCRTLARRFELPQAIEIRQEGAKIGSFCTDRGQAPACEAKVPPVRPPRPSRASAL